MQQAEQSEYSCPVCGGKHWRTDQYCDLSGKTLAKLRLPASVPDVAVPRAPAPGERALFSLANEGAGRLNIRLQADAGSPPWLTSLPESIMIAGGGECPVAGVIDLARWPRDRDDAQAIFTITEAETGVSHTVTVQFQREAAPAPPESPATPATDFPKRQEAFQPNEAQPVEDGEYRREHPIPSGPVQSGTQRNRRFPENPESVPPKSQPGAWEAQGMPATDGDEPRRAVRPDVSSGRDETSPARRENNGFDRTVAGSALDRRTDLRGRTVREPSGKQSKPEQQDPEPEDWVGLPPSLKSASTPRGDLEGVGLEGRLHGNEEARRPEPSDLGSTQRDDAASDAAELRSKSSEQASVVPPGSNAVPEVGDARQLLLVILAVAFVVAALITIVIVYLTNHH